MEAGIFGGQELQSYLGDYLGYGQQEIRLGLDRGALFLRDFFETYKGEVGVDLAGLQRGSRVGSGTRLRPGFASGGGLVLGFGSSHRW